MRACRLGAGVASVACGGGETSDGVAGRASRMPLPPECGWPARRASLPLTCRELPSRRAASRGPRAAAAGAVPDHLLASRRTSGLRGCRGEGLPLPLRLAALAALSILRLIACWRSSTLRAWPGHTAGCSPDGGSSGVDGSCAEAGAGARERAPRGKTHPRRRASASGS